MARQSMVWTREQSPSPPQRSNFHEAPPNQALPGRVRWRNGVGSKSNVNVVNVAKPEYNPGRKWIPPHISKNNPSASTHPGYNYKFAFSWFENEFGPQRVCTRALPFVEFSGRISNNIHYYWKCKPIQVVCSTISTVYHRLMNMLFKRHGKKSFMLDNLVIRLAAYYVFTKNDWFFNRATAMLNSIRRGGSRLKPMLYALIARLDDDTRFVYRHVCSQAKWLKSRSERPLKVRTEASSVPFDDFFVEEDAELLPNGSILSPKPRDRNTYRAIIRRTSRVVSSWWMCYGDDSFATPTV